MRDHEPVVRMNSTDGRDTHDAPPMTLAHVGNDGTAKSAHGRELGRGHLLPVRLRSRHYATRTCSPSIVDHNIDAAETLHGGFNHAIGLARITHICRNPQHFDAEPVANVLGCLGKALGTSGDKNKIHTTFCKLRCDCTTDPSTCSSYNGGLPRDAQVHELLTPSGCLFAPSLIVAPLVRCQSIRQRPPATGTQNSFFSGVPRA